MSVKILLVEDDLCFAKSVKSILAKEMIETEHVTTAADAIKMYRSHEKPFATVVIDQHLPDLTGDELASTIHRINKEQDIIFATADQNSETLVSLLQTGVARGFIPKGKVSSDQLKEHILISTKRWQNELRLIGEDDIDLTQQEKVIQSVGMIGKSKALYEVAKKVILYRKNPAPTLILGESGVGKELIAQAAAGEGKKVFSINCSQFISGEQFVESQLFGVVKGAFTGADKDRPGIFETAHGQAVFLDEIHMLPLAAQAKLLRVLEEKKFRRFGDTSGREIPCDVHLICAGQPLIMDKIKSKEFMRDFYYRISTYVISIPSLSERKEDIEPLVEYFSKVIASTQGQKKVFRASTIRVMEDYSWQGNVRELFTAVFNLVGTTKSEVIEPSDFANFLKDKEIQKSPDETEELGYHGYMRLSETRYLTQVLENSSSQRDAAKRVGINKSTFNHRLKILGINPEDHLSRNLKGE